MADKIVIFVTAATKEEARKIGERLVEEKLAACANILSPVQSVFYWQGKICDEAETMLIIKSTMDNFEKIEQRVKQLHRYEVPEIIALPIIAGSKEYLSWIESSLSRSARQKSD